MITPEYARHYTHKLGWVVHPLSSWNSKKNSPGKSPTTKNWSKSKKPLTDNKINLFFELEKDSNIGLVAGEASGVTVIDFDDLTFWSHLTDGVDTENWIISKRTDGRCHFFSNTTQICYRLLVVDILR